MIPVRVKNIIDIRRYFVLLFFIIYDFLFGSDSLNGYIYKNIFGLKADIQYYLRSFVDLIDR